MRDIAARAGIDPAMVIRYFGSKDGLFARAAVFDLRAAGPGGDRPGPSSGRRWCGTSSTSGRADGSGHGVLLRSAASNEDAARAAAARSSPARCCRRWRRAGAAGAARAGRAGREPAPRPGALPLRAEAAAGGGADARADRARRGRDGAALSGRLRPREPIERSRGAGARRRARYTRVEPGQRTRHPWQNRPPTASGAGFFVGLVLAAAGMLALAWVYPPRPPRPPEIGAGALEAPSAPGQPQGAAEPEAPRSGDALLPPAPAKPLIADAPGAGRRAGGRRRGGVALADAEDDPVSFLSPSAAAWCACTAAPG